MDSLNYNSVENIPGYEARAAFTVNSSSVFKEDVDIVPTIVDDTLSYMPWGGDNQMPFNILELIEKDETLATCQCFNAEVCYGSGLQYTATEASAAVRREVEDFTLDNDLASYFLGVSQDFKHFGFAVSVLILNEAGTKVVRLLRKEACYCRFTPADKHGRISKILYAKGYLVAQRHRGNRPARPGGSVARSARQTRPKEPLPKVRRRVAHTDRGLNLLSYSLLWSVVSG